MKMKMRMMADERGRVNPIRPKPTAISNIDEQDEQDIRKSP
jgi:hypothetical protein